MTQINKGNRTTSSGHTPSDRLCIYSMSKHYHNSMDKHHLPSQIMREILYLKLVCIFCIFISVGSQINAVNGTNQSGHASSGMHIIYIIY